MPLWDSVLHAGLERAALERQRQPVWKLMLLVAAGMEAGQWWMASRFASPLLGQMLGCPATGCVWVNEQ